MTPETVQGITNAGPCIACEYREASAHLWAPDRFHLREKRYPLLRCSQCGLVWLNYPLCSGDMAYHYDDAYHKFITTAGDGASKMWDEHWKVILRQKSGGKILDVGCSSGSFLAAAPSKSWHLFGIEISTAQAQEASTRTGARVFVGDILHAPFPPQSFDVITCFHVLEHHEQPLQVLSKAWEWLKPGGVMYIIVPNIESWEARLFGTYWYGLELPRHLYHFSPKSLRHMGSLVGFQAIRVKTPPDSVMEHSFRYVVDDMVQKLGFVRTPLSAGQPAGFWLKAPRKIFRLSVELLFRHTASFAGRGAFVQALFLKSELASSASPSGLSNRVSHS